MSDDVTISAFGPYIVTISSTDVGNSLTFNAQPPIDDIETYWTPMENAQAQRMLKRSIVGAPDTVRKGMAALIEETGADDCQGGGGQAGRGVDQGGSVSCEGLEDVPSEFSRRGDDGAERGEVLSGVEVRKAPEIFILTFIMRSACLGGDYW